MRENGCFQAKWVVFENIGSTGYISSGMCNQHIPKDHYSVTCKLSEVILHCLKDLSLGVCTCRAAAALITHPGPEAEGGHGSRDAGDRPDPEGQ